jgi:hypothetical protein
MKFLITHNAYYLKDARSYLPFKEGTDTVSPNILLADQWRLSGRKSKAESATKCDRRVTACALYKRHFSQPME